MNIATTVAPSPNGTNSNGSGSNSSTTTRRITRQTSSANDSSSASTNGAPPASNGNTPSGEQLLERAVILVLEMSRAGNRRTVSSEEIEIDADRDEIRVSKRLLEAPQLRAILTHDRAIRRFIKSRCLPSYFRSGMALLPLALVEVVDVRLEELAAQREVLVARFIEDYPDLVINAQSRLRGLFDPHDYPDPEVVRGAFQFSWRYITLSVPTTLAAIDRSIFTREREKAAEQWDEAARSIQTLLRANMAELIGHMTERLTPGPDGQPKSFGNSLIGKITEFLRNFDARNITDDAALAALVARARELLEGVDPYTLRRSDNLRETVREGFTGLQRSLDQMVGNRPARRIVMNRPAPGQNAESSAAQSSTTPQSELPPEPRPEPVSEPEPVIAPQPTEEEMESWAAIATEPEVTDTILSSSSPDTSLPEVTDSELENGSGDIPTEDAATDAVELDGAGVVDVDAADLGDPFTTVDESETPDLAAIVARRATRRRADDRVPLAVQTTPEFTGFRAMSRRAGLPWTTETHAAAFEGAMQAAAGILTVIEDMSADDYACAARLITEGRLRG